jgi:K+-transporting ATPase c subunit
MVLADMLTSSASGLDPDINLANAAHQVARVEHAGGVRSVVCTENHIRVYQVTESAKLAQW